jgi:hypothetical protein
VENLLPQTSCELHPSGENRIQTKPHREPRGQFKITKHFATGVLIPLLTKGGCSTAFGNPI